MDANQRFRQKQNRDAPGNSSHTVQMKVNRFTSVPPSRHVRYDQAVHYNIENNIAGVEDFDPRPFKCAWTLPQRNFLEAVNGFADTTTYSPTGRLGDIWDATEKEIRASFLAVGLD